MFSINYPLRQIPLVETTISLSQLDLRRDSADRGKIYRENSGKILRSRGRKLCFPRLSFSSLHPAPDIIYHKSLFSSTQETILYNRIYWILLWPQIHRRTTACANGPESRTEATNPSYD